MNEFGIIAGLKGFLRPLEFQGRSTRTEAIALAVAYSIVLIILHFTGELAAWLHGKSGLRWLPLLLALYPWPAMLVRRAHDAGQGAWIALVAVIFSAAPLLIIWPGDEEANEFGPNPRLVETSADQILEGAL